MNTLEIDSLEKDNGFEYGSKRREFFKDNLYSERVIDDQIHKFSKKLDKQNDIKVGTYVEDGKIKKNNYIDKPINSKSVVMPNVYTKGFLLNDNEMYKLPIKNIKKLEEDKRWNNTSFNTKMIIGIGMAIAEYFGLYGDEELRREIYDDADRAINSEEMKGKNIAVCSERSAMAQNLASFLGIKSDMIIGKLKYTDDGKYKTEDHAFNVFDFDGNKYIVDYTNHENMFPALQNLDNESFENLKEGKHITVNKVRNKSNVEYWKE